MTSDGQAGGEEAWKMFSTVLDGLAQGDVSTVFYPYPRNEKDGLDKRVRPYPINGLRNQPRINPYAKENGGRGRGKGKGKRITKWKKIGDVNKYAHRDFWVVAGQRMTYRVYIGHTEPITEIFNPAFQDALMNKGITFEKALIQAPSTIIVGWLQHADPKAVNEKEYSTLLQSQERFKIFQ